MNRDHYVYDREKVEGLLPACWDDEFGVLASKAEQEVHGGGDPAHGGGLLAMVMDVRRAYGVLDKFACEVLYARYHHGLSLSVIVELGGMEDEQEAADEIDSAVRQMIEFLGGAQ